jgi:serralysin
MPDIFETTDAPNNAGTTYTLGLGQTAQGNLTFGDGDYYRINVVAGHTYTIAMIGTGNPAQRVLDPYMNLIDVNGSTILLSDDDGGPDISAQIHFTANTTGTFFLDAGSFQAQSSGQYGVSFIEGTRANFDAEMGAGDLMRPYADQNNPQNNRFSSSWSTPGTPATITWGVRATFANSVDSQGQPAPFSLLSAAEVTAVQTALAFYSEVARLTFVQVNPGGTTDNATMLYSNYNTTTDGSGAYAVFPVGSPGDTSAGSNQGDVRFNISQDNVSTTDLHRGSYSFQTTLHETGHALGMPHPGEYNATPGQAITYDHDAQFMQDSHQYTVMSYFDESNTGAHFQDYPQTLMMFDILAMQELYGANYTTRSGNTIYGFGSNAGGVYDFSTNHTPALCIWDGGGTDTLNVSGFSQASLVNLGPGTFSNVGGYTSNVSIAVGAIIENASTGAAADTLIGNSVANTLNGGAGADTMRGLAGNDVYVMDNVGDHAIELAGQGTDTVLASISFALGANVENLTLTGTANLTGTGNALANVMHGNGGANTLYGQNGADTLDGGAGNDILSGGNDNDHVTGGTGTDTVYGGNGDDTLWGDGDDDVVSGGVGNDVVGGGAGNDTVYGGADNDSLDGGIGVDLLSGGSGNDTLAGGDQGDTLYGGVGSDSLSGDAGNDTVSGGAGNDVLRGGANTDQLLGAAGIDNLDGGAGNDTLTGGSDADIFVFAHGYQSDTVQGFENNIDTIRLDDNLWGGGKTVAQVLASFVHQTSVGVVDFDFGGGDTLHVIQGHGITIAQLQDDISIV